MPRRLYVTGSGESLEFCIVDSLEDAKLTLGATCRLPDPDDLRIVWQKARLGEIPGAEITARYGVSRQTVDNWWRKAGGEGLLRRSDQQELERVERVKRTLLKLNGRRLTVVAKAAHVSPELVRDVANDMGITLPKWHRRPSDEELIELASGKTWMEFAEVAGLKLSTLRAYIYARPALSDAISKVRASAARGRKPGKIDPQKVLQLYQEGLSAYKIAQLLKVEQMSIRHWIKRLTAEGANDQTRNERAATDSVARSNGGAVV